MPDLRPDPDELLASLKQAEAKSRRGRLKVFLGMCPGVGKTYAMLRAAQQERAVGANLVVGVVETHGRKETEALLAGLTVVPRKVVEHRGFLEQKLPSGAFHHGHIVKDLLDHVASNLQLCLCIGIITPLLDEFLVVGEGSLQKSSADILHEGVIRQILLGDPDHFIRGATGLHEALFGFLRTLFFASIGPGNDERADAESDHAKEK